MKKNAILSCLLLGISFASCKKEKPTTPTSSQENLKQKVSVINFTTETIGQKQQYLDSILKNTAKYIISTTQANSDNRQIIYSELEKQVDGDENAIIDLFYTKISALNSDENFITSLSNFNDLEGTKYFPQIYIHNYTTLKAAGKIGNSNPILAVFYTGDESQTSVKAYKLNTDNNWEFVKTVDETTTENEEIWVFSLNETFENKIDLSILPTGVIPIRPPLTGPSTNVYCLNGDKYWPYIQKMQISDRKESWLGGKSDIWMSTFTTWNTPGGLDPCNPSIYGRYFMNNASGQVPIRKYSKNEVVHQTNITVNFGYTGQLWRPGNFGIPGISSQQGDAFNYVIFEKDSWPVGNRQTSISNSYGDSQYFTFRSADDQYDKGIILFWGPSGTHMNGYVGNVPGETYFNSRL